MKKIILNTIIFIAIVVAVLGAAWFLKAGAIEWAYMEAGYTLHYLPHVFLCQFVGGIMFALGFTILEVVMNGNPSKQN